MNIEVVYDKNDFAWINIICNGIDFNVKVYYDPILNWYDLHVDMGDRMLVRHIYYTVDELFSSLLGYIKEYTGATYEC